MKIRIGWLSAMTALMLSTPAPVLASPHEQLRAWLTKTLSASFGEVEVSLVRMGLDDSEFSVRLLELRKVCQVIAVRKDGGGYRFDHVVCGSAN